MLHGGFGDRNFVVGDVVAARATTLKVPATSTKAIRARVEVVLSILECSLVVSFEQRHRGSTIRSRAVNRDVIERWSGRAAECRQPQKAGYRAPNQHLTSSHRGRCTRMARKGVTAPRVARAASLQAAVCGSRQTDIRRCKHNVVCGSATKSHYERNTGWNYAQALICCRV